MKRSMNRVFATLATALVLALPCAADELPGTAERKVVEIKNLSGDRLRRATELISNFLMPGGDARFDAALGVVLLRGQPAQVTAAEALLRRFDVPQADRQDAQVRFTLYLVEASHETESGGPIPPVISGAVEQMKKTFQYKSYRLLDTIMLQTKAGGSASLNGAVAADTAKDPRPPGTYQLAIDKPELTEHSAVTVSNFRFSMRLPQTVSAKGDVQFFDAGLMTNLTIQKGQKLVIGKLSSQEIRNAIFLIITADIE